MRPKPLVLVILDGWGYSEETAHNAIARAAAPVWNALMRDYPHGLINASETYVGLPSGQMGNSEVGHMNIGSGRVLTQDLPRIDAAIEDGSLKKNPALLDFIKKTKSGTGVVHLLGLLSPGGVHSHQHHIAVLAKILAEAGVKIWVHVFTDGRDTPPKSAVEYLEEFEKDTEAYPNIAIATVCGRFYAMDRDKRWGDRISAAYATIVGSDRKRPEHALNAIDAIKQSYDIRNSDEFVIPATIGNFPGIQNGDSMLCANFRSDRVRQLLAALLDPAFKEFERYKTIKFSAALGMMEYSKPLNAFMPALFPPQPLTNIFGEIISQAGLKQLRIAETEKYAHVTFFFNGGREQEFPGEERIMVPSPKVATYDLKPEMSAPEVTDKLLEAIKADRFDVIIVNYANTDMVGHSGNIEAAAKAVEAVDKCLGKLSEAVLAKGGALLITADHGNVEMMFDNATHQPHTAHTLNLVPVIIAAERFKGKPIKLPEGKLADIAPTLLQLLELPQPVEMTGLSLLAGCGDVGMWGCRK